MRIFLALAGSPVPGYASSLWTRNLHDPLVEMSHDVVAWDGGIQPLFDLDPNAPETAPVRARFSEAFLDAVRAADRARSLDLVLTYLGDSHLELGAIDDVRERIAPIVNFSCNNVHQFHLVRATAPRFTACLVPEREALASYREVGANAVFFPMAANPAFYRPVEASLDFDATFAGQRYADRAGAVLALREARVDAHAFGQGWQPDGEGAPPSFRPRDPLGDLLALARNAARGRDPLRAIADRRDWQRLRARHPDAVHGPVTDAEYNALFSRSRISLGFLKLGDTHRTRRTLRQVRLREFEAPMAGAFYLTEWLDELAEHYEIGVEIVCWRDHDELVDRCRWYLGHAEERERIRRAGHERALRDHTWTRRFANLFARFEREGVLGRGEAHARSS